jgi:hypothetical protein
MKPLTALALRSALTLAAFIAPTISQALVLNGAGTATQLTGSLGTVDVVSLSDSPTLTGYLNSGGLSDPAPDIPVKRVQYDLLNNAGNGSIFEFRVDFPVGTGVIAAGNPGRFIDSAGTFQSYWAGSNYAMVLDAGFGTYTYDLPFGSEWQVVYAPDHVTWEHLGNGFFPDTATGRTDLGTALPTFALFFDPATPLGLQPGLVTGRLATGGAVSASGQVLSAVPEPHTWAILGVGLVVLAASRLRRSA